MMTFKVVINEEKNLRELEGLVEIYEELAATQMQKIRTKILSSRFFYDGLMALSDEVGSDFEKILAQRSRRTAAVFIAADTGLYGDIIDKTFFLFLAYLKQNNVDVYIIGKLGEELMKQYLPGVSYQLLAEKESLIIISQIMTYRKIVVFYGKFKNLAVQLPIASSVSGELLSKQEDKEVLRKKRLSYLYEPSPEEVTAILAHDIFTSVFYQMVEESRLSKLAARLMYLDNATDNIDKNLRKVMVQKRRIKSINAGRKQRAMICGIRAREVT